MRVTLDAVAKVLGTEIVDEEGDGKYLSVKMRSDFGGMPSIQMCNGRIAFIDSADGQPLGFFPEEIESIEDLKNWIRKASTSNWGA